MVCQTVEDGLFSQLLLELVQGPKGNEKKKRKKRKRGGREGARGEKEQGERRSKGMIIHPVASASTLVLGDPRCNSAIEAHQGPAE